VIGFAAGEFRKSRSISAAKDGHRRVFWGAFIGRTDNHQATWRAGALRPGGQISAHVHAVIRWRRPRTPQGDRGAQVMGK